MAASGCFRNEQYIPVSLKGTPKDQLAKIHVQGCFLGARNDCNSIDGMDVLYPFWTIEPWMLFMLRHDHYVYVAPGDHMAMSTTSGEVHLLPEGTWAPAEYIEMEFSKGSVSDDWRKGRVLSASLRPGLAHHAARRTRGDQNARPDVMYMTPLIPVEGGRLADFMAAGIREGKRARARIIRTRAFVPAEVARMKTRVGRRGRKTTDTTVIGGTLPTDFRWRQAKLWEFSVKGGETYQWSELAEQSRLARVGRKPVFVRHIFPFGWIVRYRPDATTAQPIPTGMGSTE